MNKPGTQSIARALGLLKQFHAAPELSLAELRDRSGLNRSTVLRLLGALESEGMLVRDPRSRSWRLGPQVAALGRLADSGLELPALAQPELERLAGRLHETATLELLHGSRVRIVAEAMGGQLLGALPSLNSHWPAHATASGKLLWSTLDARERDALLAERRERFTANTFVTRAALQRELRAIAKRGWASNREELEAGYFAVAVPVRDGRGLPIAALAMGGPRQRFGRARVEQVVARLRSASERITRRLGS